MCSRSKLMVIKVLDSENDDGNTSNDDKDSELPKTELQLFEEKYKSSTKDVEGDVAHIDKLIENLGEIIKPRKLFSIDKKTRTLQTTMVEPKEFGIMLNREMIYYARFCPIREKWYRWIGEGDEDYQYENLESLHKTNKEDFNLDAAGPAYSKRGGML